MVGVSSFAAIATARLDDPAPAASSTPAPATSQPAPPSSEIDPSNSSAQNNALADEMPPELEPAIQRGLKALAASQKADGTFGDDRWGRSVAITSLASLALMADGNLPGRGTYGENVERGMRHVVDAVSESGLIAGEQAAAPMYGHGFATLFLGEVYGMTSGGPDTPESTKLHAALLKAVRLIQSTQNDEGGWRYNPIPNDADVSVTIAQIMALRSARNAGLDVPRTTIDRAVEYVRKCQNDDGGFMYQLTGGPSAWPRSAAGIASLQYAGIYSDKAIDKGVNYLVREAMPGNSPGGAHYYYGHYYAVQAMYLAGGDAWAKWWPAIRDELLKSQNADGTWDDPSVGDTYGTAMALIILQMPKRYLPIFQK
ncbi:MAG: prenyltransferase/squalene oxidase repeat-containing protein [Planctomycetota bacterium]|nr:prenyltransferase/squalene oxidase repeat-containing protein [Planctomycetota bacterium]